MFTINILEGFGKKILFIKELNNSILINKKMSLEEGVHFISEEKLLEIIKSQSEEEYSKFKNIILKSQKVLSQDISTLKKNYPVYTLCMHPSRTCNLVCKYCFANDSKEYLSKKGIDIKMAKKAIDFLVDNYGNNANKYQIDIAGSGEPLLKFDFIKQLDEYCLAKSSEVGKEIKIMFPTNATLLNEEMLEYLNKSSTILLGISLDGNEEQSANRLLKNGENAYKNIAQGAKLIDRPFGIAVTITHINEAVDEVYDYLYKEFPKADSISMQFVRNYDLLSDISFYKINIDNLVLHYKKLVDNLLVHINEKDYNYVYTLLRGSDTFGKYIFRCLKKGLLCTERCGAGKSAISVDDNGDIYSCSVANGDEYFKIGNLDEGIDLKKQEKFRKTNVTCNKSCKKCWAAYICSGECLVKSYLTNNNIYEPNKKICELKLQLIKLSILFVEKLKNENPESYKILRDFKVDNTKFDTSLWTINYFLKSRNIQISYKNLMEKVERTKYGIRPDKLKEFIKQYDNDFKFIEITNLNIYSNINYPAIAYINRFKYAYQYLIIEGFENNVLKIRDARNNDIVEVQASEFENEISNIIMSTTKK